MHDALENGRKIKALLTQSPFFITTLITNNQASYSKKHILLINIKILI